MVQVKRACTESAACALKVEQGMVAHAKTPRIAVTRELVLEMLLAGYRDVAFKSGAAADMEFISS
jgi:NADH dehydrogenase/NADH:ubiquinone oxidoreductase subunit G